MDADLVAQIKAGEVIERPASAVKELIENAIDAGAKRIRVEISEGGTRLVRVVDDGYGIPPGELALAFAEHSSSKLHSADQLASIETLGFRGEALYAISNVSRVEAISGEKGSGEAAAVTIDHGRMVLSEPAAPGGGTRIAVHDLFAKVPARRKHLRSARSESAAVHQVVAQYAIGHPGVAMNLLLDGRVMLSAPGSGRIEDAFASVYGADLVTKMIPIQAAGDVSVSGLVSPPSVTRPNRGAIMIIVNGRPVRSAALTFAIEDAYSGLLMVGRHPLAAISIVLPAEQIDPNVHPTKLEVRFVADRPVFSAVRTAVANAVSTSDRVVEASASLGSVFDEGRDQILPGFPEVTRPPYPDGISFASPAPVQAEPAPTFQHALPSLRVFGQAALTFIVAEGASGLYMIDQHAAHERVLFDSLTVRTGRLLRQPLLEPARIELTAEQWATFESQRQMLDELGFELEPFGGNWCLVRSVPIAGSRPVAAEVVVEVIDALSDARPTADIFNRALTVVACKAAVKAGQTLSMSEMRELIGALEKTENPRTCPHGRPTTIHISTERLEREFGRR
jgi:DNA mismatch repair protein MutL